MPPPADPGGSPEQRGRVGGGIIVGGAIIGTTTSSSPSISAFQRADFDDMEGEGGKQQAPNPLRFVEHVLVLLAGNPHTRSMERMAGVDAGFLYMETPSQHMHTLKIALIDPPADFDMTLLSTELLARLDLLPPLQRRAVRVPLQLNHPVWVADRQIDPARHIRAHQVAAPGGMAELEALIGRIASTPLARDAPLWELHVCHGLADGRLAVVAKLHHALADGSAANALLGNVTDRPGRPERHAEIPPIELEKLPSPAALAMAALRDAVRQLAALPALLRHTAAALVALFRHKRTAPVRVPRPILDTPRASFNGPLTARRSFATCTLPLEDIKRVKQLHGVTVNDVVLAVVAGALRAWLQSHDEHLRKPLMAAVPVATDDPDAAPRLSGNNVSNLFTTLATDIADPVERLRTISRVTAEAKVIQRMLGSDMLTDWVQFTPPGPFSAFMRLYSRAHLAALHPPPINVVVSNVAGPREQVTIAGARLDDLFSVGPILEGIGLNVTAWSYQGRMNFSLLTCPDVLPDLDRIVAGLRPALEALAEREEALA
jgi:diacylglycerol O-acyltransferase / wax synthase